MAPFHRLSAWLRQSITSRRIGASRRQHRLRAVSLRLEELEHRITPSGLNVVPEQFTTNQYTAVTLTQNQLLAGDTASVPLQAINLTQPANATLVDNHNGTFTFTPNAAFSGSTTFQYTVTAQETVGDGFGSSVSVSGDTAVVGSPLNPGAAYVFVRSGNTWVQQAVLNPADGTANIAFGSSVSIDGDTVVIGAPGTIAQGTAGAAYVFVRSGSTWSQQAVLTVPNSNLFGEQVSVSGDTVVSSIGAGSAYVYVRSGSTWSQQAVLATPNDPSYIASVSISGDTAVIGKPTSPQGGTAYVFVRSGTNWSQQAVINTPDSTFTSGYFAVSVSISGDTAVIGADQEPVNGAGGQGAAYVYVRSGSTWSQQAVLTTAGIYFGSSVSVSGDTAIVGAVAGNFTGFGPVSPGAAYVFARSGSTWSQQAVLPAAGENLNVVYGAGDIVATDGDTVVYGRADANVGQASVADVYALSGNTWSEQAELSDPDVASVTATVQVNPATAQLFVSPINLAVGHAEQVYPTTTFTATGGAGSGYTFQESGILPPGIAFDPATGQLTGTPTQDGEFPGIVIAASDGHGGSGSQTYTLTINHAGVNGLPLPYPQTIYAPPTPASDPNADLDAFIRGLYHSVLDRDVESDTSLKYWEIVFMTVQSNPQFLSVPPGTDPYLYVAQGFWNSQEHRQDEVMSYYQDFLGRTLDLSNPYDANGLAYWTNHFLLLGWQEGDVVRGFLTSPEYLYDHRADASLANALNTTLLNGAATTADLQLWTNLLSALDTQRAAIQNQTFATPEDYKAQLSADLVYLDDENAGGQGVLLDMLGSSEYEQAAVQNFYLALLRRSATASEVQGWLAQSNAINIPLDLDTIPAMMLASAEYRTNAANSVM